MRLGIMHEEIRMEEKEKKKHKRGEEFGEKQRKAYLTRRGWGENERKSYLGK